MRTHQKILNTLKEWHPITVTGQVPLFSLQARLPVSATDANTAYCMVLIKPYSFTNKKTLNTGTLRLDCKTLNWTQSFPCNLGVESHVELPQIPARGAIVEWKLSFSNSCEKFVWLTRGEFSISVLKGAKRVIQSEVTNLDLGLKLAEMHERRSSDQMQLEQAQSQLLRGIGPSPLQFSPPPNFAMRSVADAECHFAASATSQEQWREVMGTSLEQFVGHLPALDRDKVLKWKGDDRPMIGVPLWDAMKFCQRLTIRERQAHRLPPGWIYRLPTPAEWRCVFDLGEPTSVWSSKTLKAVGELGPQPVQSGKPGPGGIYHLRGNTWEWTPEPGVDLHPGRHAPAMGGSWYKDDEKHCFGNQPIGHEWKKHSSRVGFRVILAPLFKTQWYAHNNLL